METPLEGYMNIPNTYVLIFVVVFIFVFIIYIYILTYLFMYFPQIFSTS